MRHLLVVIVLLAGCKTAAPIEAAGPSRGMLGLEDEPLAADWTEWKPDQTASTPANLAEQATAFDYWQITDAETREEAWAAIFALLGEVRRVAPYEYDPTMRMLMTVLEPTSADGDAMLDATFFAARPDRDGMWEGVAWRMWRDMPSGAAPGVSVWLRRHAGSPDHATEAVVWLYGGFEETRSLSLRLVGGDQWAMTIGEGLRLDASTPVPGETQLLRGIVLSTFWDPVIGRAYLESEIERHETALPTPGQHPEALGLTLTDRDIEQVFTDSVFAPRLTLFPAKSPSPPD